jgi:peptide/nickel transport system substrate-binding protein
MLLVRFPILALLPLLAAVLAVQPAGAVAAYQESPWLSADVSAGRLPPIGERLPSDPLVVDLKAEDKEIGRPGGTLRLMIGQGGDARSLLPFAYSRLIIYDRNYRLVPDILASFEVKDGRIFTLHLRKAHRWSDGSPFTAEDFRYYWEEIANNPKLNPDGLPPALRANGLPPSVEIIDQTTVRYTWVWPNQAFLPALAAASPLMIYRPAHYLKQFNPKYTSAQVIGRMLAEAKLDDWTELHRQRDDPLLLGNPEMPTLAPWTVISRPGSQVFAAVRNPYYHRIDKKGHQLPYIDRLVLIPQTKSQIADAVVAGKSDLQATGLTLGDLPALRAAAKAGVIKLDLWPSGQGSQLALYPNLNAKDPVWRALMRDQRFRRALSLGVDRATINQKIYGGMAKPRANTLLADSPLFDPDAQKAWSEFDIARSQELLDGMGLRLDKKYGIRRLPDGRLLSLLVAIQGADPTEIAVLRLIQDSWRKIGIELMIGAPLPSAFHARVLDGSTVMSLADGLANGLATPEMNPAEFTPSNQGQLQWPRWGLYEESGGAEGDPADLPAAEQLVQLWKSWRDARAEAAKVAAWRKIIKINADEVFSIGLVGEVPQPIAVSPRLHNVPDRDFYNWEPGAYFGLYRPDSFWLSEKPSEP